MKKIINKIKANQNLCKVLKVLKLVLDLIVYGFAIFMILGLCIGQSKIHYDSKAQERQLISSEVVTPVKNAYRTSNYTIYSVAGDIGCDNFLEGMFQQYRELTTGSDGEYGDYALITDWAYVSNGTTWTYTFSNNNGTTSPLGYLLNWSNVNFNTLSTYNNSNYLIAGFKFTLSKSATYNRQDGTRFKTCTFDVNFVLSNSTSNAMKIAVDFYYDNSNQIRFYAVSQTESVYAGNAVILVNKNINNTILESICSTNVPAYQLGYEAGYNEGISSVEHQNNGVFGLISQAFYSIADILNITLLPGFTLGTLIAVPIVVMVIIVLFKMFRG